VEVSIEIKCIPEMERHVETLIFTPKVFDSERMKEIV
jgi:hypothetical protein